MEVVLVVLAAGTIAGTAVWAVLRRWPHLDPASPRVAVRAVADGISGHPTLERAVERQPAPAAATGLYLTGAVATVAVALMAVGGLIVMVETNSGFARWDRWLAEWGASHATDWAASFLRDVSQLGGTLEVVTVAVVVAAIELVRTRRVAVVAFLATVMIGISILLNLVKFVVDRTRPDILRLTGFSGSSFPSGHAATSAAMFAAFALVLGRQRSPSARVILNGVAVGIAVAVATTRVMLGVHWFTDVLAGLALGWAWFAICSIAFGGRLLRFGAPIEAAERVEARRDDHARTSA
jgi:undecaprenyl-diphosphatase